MTRLYHRLLLVATLLAFAVIALGAYVRLSDAGLGCPDWPGCYGHWLGVPEAHHEQQAAAQAYPDRPLDTGKAWKEMLHRYLAGTLGLLILALCILAWRKESRSRQSPALPTALLGIVGLQAALGMWTVTLLLKPVIVTLHLIGGMTTLSILVGMAVAGREARPDSAVSPGMRLLAAGALLAIAIQIALGGWVSSNYAALACPDFPTCQGQWQPEMDFAHAFSLHRELGETANGQLLPHTALTAIHWSHRLGAALVSMVVAMLALTLFKTGRLHWQVWGGLLALLLLAQLSLGIANVLLGLPLAIAVAHNLGAALLLTATLTLNISLYRQRLPASNASALSGPSKTAAG
ncbi:COX15/CtaA family protein [Ferribacterium limneticum]|nr:COX15/CtaA family protein [Ferribacterium limneticum]